MVRTSVANGNSQLDISSMYHPRTMREVSILNASPASSKEEDLEMTRDVIMGFVDGQEKKGFRSKLVRVIRKILFLKND